MDMCRLQKDALSLFSLLFPSPRPPLERIPENLPFQKDRRFENFRNLTFILYKSVLYNCFFAEKVI